MQLHLLLYRVLYNVMVGAGALTQHLVNLLHIVTHHIEKILA